MIAVDTNLLLRAYLLDDPEQLRSASALLTSADEGQKLFIPYLVMLEFIWTLSIQKKLSRSQLADTVQKLLDAKGYLVARTSILRQALRYYMAGKCGFADYMLVTEAKEAGAKNLASFDRQLQKEFPDFVLSPKAFA